MPVQIHGKQYITVAERIIEAGEDFKSLNTEVLSDKPVVIKATVTTKKGIFTGISAANPDKSIEKMSPYEVAETSAVGRALGFAGYGAVEGIATADEMLKSPVEEKKYVSADDFYEKHICPTHKVQMKERISKTKVDEEGKPLIYWDHRQEVDGKWEVCFGKGFNK
jgi:hypothetical protein